MSWHIPPATMEAYVGERVPDVDAWSVEAHLVECETCRGRLATVAEGTATGAVVARVRTALPAELPVQGRIREANRLRAVSMLAASGPAARRAWLAATAIVLAMSLILDGSGQVLGAIGTQVSWLTLLAPLIPVIGVAVSYDSGLDDAHEIVASTPSGGLRLLLWRTVAVLAVTTPTSLLAGAWVSSGSPVRWLLPALAMTLLTLALGSWTGIGSAAAAVGAGWTVIVAGPALMTGSVPLVIGNTMSVWLPVATFSAAAVALRARSFDHPR